jgi:hypothetical protein
MQFGGAVFLADAAGLGLFSSLFFWLSCIKHCRGERKERSNASELEGEQQLHCARNDLLQFERMKNCQLQPFFSAGCLASFSSFFRCLLSNDFDIFQ